MWSEEWKNEWYEDNNVAYMKRIFMSLKKKIKHLNFASLLCNLVIPNESACVSSQNTGIIHREM